MKSSEAAEPALAACSLARRARRSFFSRISAAVGIREDDEPEMAAFPNLASRSRAVWAEEGSMRSRDGLGWEERSRGVEGVELRSSSR